MRVLVACEYSGRVRDAFLARGHDALSVDLLPSWSPGPHHRGDVRDVLGDGWDLLIAHPPCDYLTNTGVQWLHDNARPAKTDTLRGPARWAAMREGAAFFRELLNFDAIPLRAVENPVMHRYAFELVGERATQYVQPWQFGDQRCKRTGLWLRGLPKLVETDNVREQTMRLPYGVRCECHHAGGTRQERMQRRSATYPGIAAAMADQWGAL